MTEDCVDLRDVVLLDFGIQLEAWTSDRLDFRKLIEFDRMAREQIAHQRCLPPTERSGTSQIVVCFDLP